MGSDGHDPSGGQNRDEDAVLEAQRQQVVDGLALAHPDLGNQVWHADAILGLKQNYLEPDLAHWTKADVEEILLDLFPRKVTLRPGEGADVPMTFAVLLRHLGANGELRAEQAEELARLALELSGRFADAMADESRWGPSKRIVTLMDADGIDVTDEAAVAAWIDRFNARPFADRDIALGPQPPTMPAELRDLLPPLPPVVLPSDDELATAAGRSVWVARLRRMVDYAGGGLAITPKGNLKLADGKALVTILDTNDRVDHQIGDHVFKTKSTTELREVDLTLRLAVATNQLEIQGSRLVPGPNADRVEPIDAWYAVFLGLIGDRIGIVSHWYGGDAYGWYWFAEHLDAALPHVLMALYRTQSWMPISELHLDLWEDLLDTYDLDDVPIEKLNFHRGLVGGALERALGRLAEHDIVDLDVPDEPEDSPDTTAVEREVPGSVRLTALGTWGVRRFLARGMDAPVVGELCDLATEELLARAADLPADHARLEIDNWVQAKGATAAAELVAALRETGPVGRQLAYQALLRLGAGAANAFTALDNDPALAPYAVLFRVDTALAAREEMTAETDAEFVRQLAAVLDVWGVGPLAGWVGPAAGRAGPQRRIDELWRLDLPETEHVLAGLGGLPDKALAKAARKSLFKLRSRIGGPN